MSSLSLCAVAELPCVIAYGPRVYNNPISEKTHRSDPRVLNRRTLERHHRTLAKLLRPGMIVLDVGCGTGAITAGIAKAVGPEGRVLGLDRDAEQVAAAKQEHRGVPI